ncbi:hypothetical protein [Kitasatospora sp. NPDC001175]
MSTNRSRRIDRSAAEQLLGGAKVGTSAGQAPLTGHAALAGLLAAAAAGTAAGGAQQADGVLPGEEAALAAFREARRNPAPLPGRRTMASTALARAFSAKVLAAVFAATTLGGVAVAAGTGHLPAALGGRPAAAGPTAARATVAASPATAHHVGAGTAASGQPRPNGAASPAADRGPEASADPGGNPAGDPSQPAGQVPDAAAERSAELCRLYADRLVGGAAARTVLADARLAPLVAAAGDVDRVDGYCTAVAARSKGNGNGGGNGTTPAPDRTKDLKDKPPTELPTKPGQPTRPGGGPGGHDTGGGNGPGR